MGIKDKASKIDFASLGGVAPAVTPASKAAKTAPGELMAFANQQRSQLLQDNEQLRVKADQADVLQKRLDEVLADLQQWDGAKAARYLDPKKVRHSRWANRLKLNFVGQAFEDLRAEIRSAGGNVQPIKVRPIPGTDEFEIVFGHRRNEACLLEGLMVLAVIDNLDDRALFIEMDRENRSRKDLSPYEQGRMYRQALDTKLFPSQKALALETGADQSLMTKALYLADLPQEVVDAFPSFLDLQFRFAKPLHDAVEQNKTRVISLAKSISKQEPIPDAKTAFDMLTAPEAKKMEPFHFPEPVVFERGGRKVGSLKITPKGVALNLNLDCVIGQDLEDLRTLVKRILDRKN